MLRQSFQLPLFVGLFVCITISLIYYISQDITWTPPTSSTQEELIQIYIYPWPKKLINCWPKSFHHHRLSFESQFQENSFEGRLLNRSHSLFHTHQYSIYQMFYQRLVHSPYYTKDPEKATHFLIPYDIGMCASTRLEDGALTATSCPQLPSIIKLLNQSKYYQRNKGYDHIIIHSINHMMLHFLNDPCQELYRQCPNCLKFSIDYYTHQLFPMLKESSHLTKNWISIPFPSNYHRIDDSFQDANNDGNNPTVLPWKRITEEPNYLSTSYLTERKYSFCFLGSLDVTAKKQRTLRMKILEFCRKYALLNPTFCLTKELTTHGSNTLDYLHILTENRTALAMLENKPDDQNLFYDHCRFCLIPGGDFPTRKAFFDAMLSGCIPMTFQLETAHQQWPYHWQSKVAPLRAIAYYPREKFMQRNHQQNYAEFRKISQNLSQIHAKLSGIAEIANRLQYNHLPIELLMSKQRTYKPHEKDAFEVIMDILRTTVIVVS